MQLWYLHWCKDLFCYCYFFSVVFPCSNILFLDSRGLKEVDNVCFMGNGIFVMFRYTLKVTSSKNNRMVCSKKLLAWNMQTKELSCSILSYSSDSANSYRSLAKPTPCLQQLSSFRDFSSRPSVLQPRLLSLTISYASVHFLYPVSVKI